MTAVPRWLGLGLIAATAAACGLGAPSRHTVLSPAQAARHHSRDWIIRQAPVGAPRAHGERTDEETPVP
ncbi:hypothetical protein [Candidatus Methylocalor cossyra]|uniref:Lipoprotein n=1 Tax=Candidatus Methylocalor cossyra TaxID=3108543 RepID=A0ABM9NM68_9GAMM